ncbi:MAG: aminotransferase class I/II-fold pyridoxal phosphate-dependent enzyme [Proteobacteria bacterium]|jgi:DNA-binding transcriptional MocR family regulator|nr:aminotransferase class I/II-fold pyridoxal phosphate-dependent enzyme [Pseudomonadota bacterium]MDA1299850.1 aminotransferase class I/II-fold pyridoxal phosphate-dependent enzyme [Pseudomonadota bacterium]
MQINSLNPEQLRKRQTELAARYEAVKAASLSLDLTRGKPAPAQLDLANAIDGILDGFYLLQDGTDVRNYGGILGIPEARQLGGQFLNIDPGLVLVGGNSSLALMYQYVAHMLPTWQRQTDTVRFLCPVPGYDRHFAICEAFGIEMINVPFVDGGPDMDQIESLVRDDPGIKGIWCVPMYSNPTGHTYSDDTVARFAKLAGRAGPDFRIMWDNAYAVHHLYDQPDRLANLMALATEAANEDSVVLFASTSKVTFAGAGIAFLGASGRNLAAFEKFLVPQVIGFDKVNQLRHVRFLTDVDAHMKLHADIIRPKFELVEKKLSSALADKGIARWSRPNGGYFVSLDTSAPIADRVVALASAVGVKLTPAGATFPYGKDPDNSNIRIAPTFPGMTDLDRALDVLVLCIELVAVSRALRE